MAIVEDPTAKFALEPWLWARRLKHTGLKKRLVASLSRITERAKLSQSLIEVPRTSPKPVCLFFCHRPLKGQPWLMELRSSPAIKPQLFNRSYGCFCIGSPFWWVSLEREPYRFEVYTEAPDVWKLPYRDLEPGQGEPTQTIRAALWAGEHFGNTRAQHSQ